MAIEAAESHGAQGLSHPTLAKNGLRTDASATICHILFSMRIEIIRTYGYRPPASWRGHPPTFNGRSRRSAQSRNGTANDPAGLPIHRHVISIPPDAAGELLHVLSATVLWLIHSHHTTHLCTRTRPPSIPPPTPGLGSLRLNIR